MSSVILQPNTIAENHGRRLSLTVCRLTAGDNVGEHLVLPSEAVHSIDSEELCSSDDLTSLNHLNEPNIIHGLGIRFHRSAIFLAP